ncbi:hypothetical protein N7448_011213 [Penicillium atrosanguineum]|nr:hypothetical protein N7448_011213 [Penicillium atrosanguineum]
MASFPNGHLRSKKPLFRMDFRAPLTHDDYTVGLICALSVETAAAKLMLDKIHPPLPRLPTDQNTYILGSIGEHNIVIAPLPAGAYGSTSATSVGMQLLSSFHAIRVGFMIVSQPTDTSGGVIQYDLGRTSSSGQFQRTGTLNRPPKVLLTALATLQAHHRTEDSRVHEFVSSMQATLPPCNAREFARPTQEDCLFQVGYDHVGSNTCINCDRSKLSPRPSRDQEKAVIHYGLIASANQVVKDGRRRDQLARDLGVYCVEMEAAGLMNDFPCLVVRGICDYADSHKNKEWQGYAAAVAAAYAKELLLVIPLGQITSTDTLAESSHQFDIRLDLTAPGHEKLLSFMGLGGMGKTQLAIRFARDHKDDFTAIFWLSGKDRATLVQCLSSILPRIPGQSENIDVVNNEEVEKRSRTVLRWLASEGNSRWLIIFDNIDQYAPVNSAVGQGYDIEEFFPGADHGSILITSRLQRLTELGETFPIHRLNPRDAMQLLLQSSRLLPKSTTGELESNPDILALANRLDGLPLAIVIAGAFMRESGTNVTEYLHFYQESWSDLQLISNPERQYQQGNMIQTWWISYREIQKRDPNAGELLLLLAHFDNRDIWYGLVRKGSDSPVAPVWLKRTASSELAFKSGVRVLIEFSLLESKRQEGSYMMHPVVQDWCLHLTNTNKNVSSLQLSDLALISVGYTVPAISERDYAKLQKRLMPHANYVRHGNKSDNNTSVWRAFHSLGNLYYDQGKPKEAEAMYQRALAGYEKALGPEHTSTVDTVKHLGNFYSKQGQLKEAEAMYRRALAGCEKALGPEHTSTLDTVMHLGNFYSKQGQLKEAEAMYRRALAGCEKALGPEYMWTRWFFERSNRLTVIFKIRFTSLLSLLLSRGPTFPFRAKIPSRHVASMSHDKLP